MDLYYSRRCLCYTYSGFQYGLCTGLGWEFVAISKTNGQVLWSRSISQYDCFGGAFSRSSPAIHNTDLILGDVESTDDVHQGANIIAVNRQNGALHWVTQVERYSAAVITAPPVVAGNTMVVGVSSNNIRKHVPTSRATHAARFAAALLP